jgi:aminoglycoside phosphotransferase (APT) family kinase protein
MIKKFESDFNGTKEMAEKHFIDSDKLTPYLREHISDFEGPLTIEEFVGGQSNPTYFLKTSTKSYVLRKKPPGMLLKTAHAVDREFKVISALNETNVPVPKAYLHCKDDSILGTEFFVMEYIEGSVIWESHIPHGAKNDRFEIYSSMNKTISKLHAVDPSSIGLEDFGKPGNYVARQVSRWTKQYRDSETTDIPSMNNLIDWLPNNLPSEKPTRLVHGDFSLSNVIINNENNEVASILDWELSTLGDPVADFSYHCLQYFMNPILTDENKCEELNIPNLKEYVALYMKNSEFDISDDEWNTYMGFSMFKLAAICQGITGRVRDGTAAGKDAEKFMDQTIGLSNFGWTLIQQ